MAFLRELHSGQQYALPGKIVVIGRDASCDIVVRRDQTSSRHAMVLQTGGAWYVEDLDSVNGTFVNGMRIRQRTRLKANDRIDVFGLTVQFCEEPAQPSETATLFQPAGSPSAAEQ